MALLKAKSQNVEYEGRGKTLDNHILCKCTAILHRTHYHLSNDGCFWLTRFKKMDKLSDKHEHFLREAFDAKIFSRAVFLNITPLLMSSIEDTATAEASQITLLSSFCK